MSGTIRAALAAMAEPGMEGAREGLAAAVGGDVPVHLAHPFETLEGGRGWWDAALAPLLAAMPDLERRETIRMEGRDARGALWLGSGGYYCGGFVAPFLDIPPTRRMAGMRFHEFFRLVDGAVVEIQALWDIPELMMQAGAWPLAPSLGREWHVPGPSTQDGLDPSGDGAEAVRIVREMLTALGESTRGEEAMRLGDYWHPACSWYGPSGIGTARGIGGFRRHHQIPFLNAMPDRVGDPAGGHLFGKGSYVGFTAWPGMSMTLSGGGWLGLPGAGQRLTMRSLDFWRVQDGLIRENWVLVDLLDVCAQLGVDALARMREMTGA
jgi:hypothetical protein